MTNKSKVRKSGKTVQKSCKSPKLKQGTYKNEKKKKIKNCPNFPTTTQMKVFTLP